MGLPLNVFFYYLYRILIVDWDVHHGQGTQYIFEENPRFEGFFSSLMSAVSRLLAFLENKIS